MRLCRFPTVIVYFTIAMVVSTGPAIYVSGAERSITGLATGSTSPLMLWYPTPADRWTDGMAIGNGRLGAMVFGHPEKDRLQLNDIAVWSGGPAIDADRPEGYNALPEIRRLPREGKYPEAQRLVQQNMTAQADYFPSYQTLGDLTFNFTLPEGDITDYRRWLDVSRAIAGVEFKLGWDTHKVEDQPLGPRPLLAAQHRLARLPPRPGARKWIAI